MIWVDAEINRAYGTEHFLLAGASGSGKTTVMENLMASVFVGAESGFVYDPKPEFLPLLFSLTKDSEADVEAGTSKVKVLNPLDARSCWWHMAEDIDGPLVAREIASILVPDDAGNQGSSAFFVQATRDLLAGVFLAFIRCAPRDRAWTFRDVILTMLYEPYLRFVLDLEARPGLAQLPMLSRLSSSYLNGDDPRTSSNIRASINTHLSIFEPIAARWEKVRKTHPGRGISIAKWAAVGSRDILVLGNDETARASIDPINRAMFKRATECLLSRRESTPSEIESGEGQSWVFLDEVREAGHLDGLSRLMTKSRSKGVCVVLTFQDINGLRDVYGEDVANELVAQCNNVAVMRLNSSETAEWASGLFGRRKLEAQSKNTSFGGEGGYNFGRGISEQELPYVFSADFIYLPLPKVVQAVTGFVKGPDSNPEAGLDSLKFKVTDRQGIAHGDNKLCSELIPVDPEDFYLEPWDSDDWQRLGFKGPFRDLLKEAAEASSQRQTAGKYRPATPAPTQGKAAGPGEGSTVAEAGPRAFEVVKDMLNRARNKPQ